MNYFREASPNASAPPAEVNTFGRAASPDDLHHATAELRSRADGLRALFGPGVAAPVDAAIDRLADVAFSLLEARTAGDRYVDQLRDDLVEVRGSYDGACQTIAQMHAAAVGGVQGPNRGVVEDVADVRTALEEARAFNQRALAARASQVAELESALWKASLGGPLTRPKAKAVIDRAAQHVALLPAPDDSPPPPPCTTGLRCRICNTADHDACGPGDCAWRDVDVCPRCAQVHTDLSRIEGLIDHARAAAAVSDAAGGNQEQQS